MKSNVKKISRIEKRTQEKNGHHLNNVDMDDNQDAQESVITMTSDINNDQESSIKRKRGALEDSLTTRRGPKPRRIGYSVNDLLSDEETYFYLLKNMEKQTSTKVDGQVV